MMIIRKFGHVFDTNTGNNKKYKVLVNGKYVYFGDKRYQQYRDKIGYYSMKDHGDKTRRENYRSRHQGDHINDPNFAGYWSYRYLW